MADFNQSCCSEEGHSTEARKETTYRSPNIVSGTENKLLLIKRELLVHKNSCMPPTLIHSCSEERRRDFGEKLPNKILIRGLNVNTAKSEAAVIFINTLICSY